MKKVGIGVISFAHLHGFSYIRCVAELPNAKLIAVADDDEARGRKMAEQYSVPFYNDYNELLKRDDIDGVIVTAENVKHAPIVVASAEAGKHILCEKPLATRLEDADDMLRAVKRAGVKLQTAYVMRYHTVTRFIKELLERGEIGKIVAMTGTNQIKWFLYGWFFEPDLSGGGAVMDHTVHLADLMRWYTKSEVRTVYTEIGKNIHSDVKVEDNALTLVTFENGVIGSIDGSWSRPKPFYTWGGVAMEILGTEGIIQADAFRQNINVVESNPPNDRLEWHYWGCDTDKEMIKDFVDSILEDREPRASGFDGRQGVEITLAAYESAKKGAEVTLPLK